MAINLVEIIQTNLNFPPLQKIDPNTQEVAVADNKPDEHRFSQAAVPAILTGIYKYVDTDEGAQNILKSDSTDWVSLVFEGTSDEVVQKISSYSFVPPAEAHTRMNVIAAEAVKVIRQNIKADATMMDIKDFMSGQAKTILLYLPDALHMGELLRDNTLDDNTNKMEGPISSLMHKIGAAFSNPESEDKINTKL